MSVFCQFGTCAGMCGCSLTSLLCQITSTRKADLCCVQLACNQVSRDADTVSKLWSLSHLLAGHILLNLWFLCTTPVLLLPSMLYDGKHMYVRRVRKLKQQCKAGWWLHHISQVLALHTMDWLLMPTCQAVSACGVKVWSLQYVLLDINVSTVYTCMFIGCSRPNGW